MKKVICVAAAFAMVAGVTTVASAAVDLSGSARVRARYNDAGAGDTVTKWDSRVRVKIDASTEGGGYVKARVRFLDGTWGTGGDYTAQAMGDYNVWSDYAYVGFKSGKLDFAGGKMPIAFSPWFLDDERADRFRVLYKDGGLALAFTYDKKIYEYSGTRPTGTALAVPAAEVDAAGNIVSTGVIVEPLAENWDGDKDVWGVTYRQKFSDAVNANVRVVYVADSSLGDNPITGADMNKSGIKASANVGMSFGGNNIIVEQSYIEGDVARIGADDQFGGYAAWDATFGSITPTATVGYAMNGFTADETFGWLMFGGDVPTSQVQRVGTGGDTVFLGLSSKFQTTEQLSFTGNLVFMDIDPTATTDINYYAPAVYGENPIEVSGQVKYQVGKGVELLWRAGWIASDSDVVDDAFSTYGQMEVTF